MTDQPRNLQLAQSAHADDITTFMGTIPADEYEQRRRIRTARNAASYKVTQTESADARALCWMVTECATAWIYAPADVEMLTEVAQYLRRLLIVADQAEALWSASA
jgi:hypothetical protein